jgi:nitrate/nitrite transport system permease protein
MNKFKFDWLLLPLLGIGCVLALWSFSSATWAKELPSPTKTWLASREYELYPYAKRGEI